MPCLECGRCYCQEVGGCPLVLLADVIANGMWQMFLPLQCIATIDWLMLLPSGRWNSHILLICFLCCMGRCYCPVADGMATFCIFVMADVIAQWQMEWPLQGVSVPSW